MFQIDGEKFVFNDFVKIEVVSGALELLLDFNQVMEDTGMYL